MPNPAIDPRDTNAHRCIHGASNGWPGWYVDRLGDFLLSQSEKSCTSARQSMLEELMQKYDCRGAYHKLLSRQVRGSAPADTSPRHLLGEVAPSRFHVRENGIRYELSFEEGYSVGLFLDQRENRRRILHGETCPPATDAHRGLQPDRAGPRACRPHHHRPGRRSRLPVGTPAPIASVAAKRAAVHNFVHESLSSDGADRKNREVLNVFAYTCAFSVCAARVGARVTSLDLSRKYLDWGRRNFELNGLDPEAHDFIYGDAFDWMRRLAKKSRLFDLVILDPPTFSQSKQSGVFRAEKDYGRLVHQALPLIKPGGVLFASSNAASWAKARFLGTVREAVASAKRSILTERFCPQPPDFPVSRAEPAYLKTAWFQVGPV